MQGNEHGALKRDVIYAQLVDGNGKLVISATLKFIMQSIRDGNIETENTNTKSVMSRGVRCSEVNLL